jgi:hypothetical protein
MRALGRFLQQVGLVGPPLAIVLQLVNKVTVGQMLALLVASISLFYIGRLIEGYAPS